MLQDSLELNILSRLLEMIRPLCKRSLMLMSGASIF